MRVNLRFDASNTLARNFTLESSNRKKKPLKNLLGKKRVKLCVLLSLFFGWLFSYLFRLLAHLRLLFTPYYIRKSSFIYRINAKSAQGCARLAIPYTLLEIPEDHGSYERSC